MSLFFCWKTCTTETIEKMRYRFEKKIYIRKEDSDWNEDGYKLLLLLDGIVFLWVSRRWDAHKQLCISRGVSWMAPSCSVSWPIMQPISFFFFFKRKDNFKRWWGNNKKKEEEETADDIFSPPSMEKKTRGFRRSLGGVEPLVLRGRHLIYRRLHLGSLFFLYRRSF
jgi:hypothetical protein